MKYNGIIYSHQVLGKLRTHENKNDKKSNFNEFFGTNNYSYTTYF